MAERVAPGPLVIIGGAEDKEGESRVLGEFVRLAGGARARVLVMAVASEQQAILSSVYTEVFKRLGVEEVRTLGISHRERANSAIAVEAVERATGVFFTGGSQLRITRLLGGTLLDRALHRRRRRDAPTTRPAKRRAVGQALKVRRQARREPPRRKGRRSVRRLRSETLAARRLKRAENPTRVPLMSRQQTQPRLRLQTHSHHSRLTSPITPEV